MRRLLALSLFAACLAAAPAPAPAPAFDCPAPKGWSAAPEDGRAEFLGPRDAHGIAALIEVRWIAPDDPAQPSADAYVERLTKPGLVEVPGWKTRPPETVAVAGRKARRVVLENTQFVPPHSRDSQEVRMREEHVVVPAAKGFYALVYVAPEAIAAKNRAAFKKVLAGFKPAF